MELTIDQIVYHKSFGRGVIINSDEQTIFVNFDLIGEKRLLKRFAPLSETDSDFKRQIETNNFSEDVTTFDNNGTRFDDYANQGCSNRHLEARNDSDKLTAGQMAKILTKELKRKILASEISKYANEWHHAGLFYNKFSKRMSGKKVYFFRKSDIQNLIEKLK